ncbi:MAG TPA: DUF6531 domain-containing protein [Usitatibacter sp.]|nr:DUF6531 domain-containing protein [Usitatibacter sp.]
MALIMLVASPLAEAVRFRWAVGPTVATEMTLAEGAGNAGASVAEACRRDTGFPDYHPTDGYVGQWGESFHFNCDHGGFLSSALFQWSCTGVPTDWGAIQEDPIGLDAKYCQGQKGKSNGDGCGDGDDSGSCGVGDPIFPGTGNVFEQETDYRFGALEFKRSYNSGFTNRALMGLNWRTTLDRSIATFATTGAKATVYRDDGRVITFSLLSGTTPVLLTPYNANASWVPDADVVDRLTRLVDSNGNTNGWTYYDARTDNYETYTSDGRISTIGTRSGITLIVGYNAQLQASSITDSFGRALTFTYVNDRIATMTDPVGYTYQYLYNSNGALDTVIYPVESPLV